MPKKLDSELPSMRRKALLKMEKASKAVSVWRIMNKCESSFKDTGYERLFTRQEAIAHARKDYLYMADKSDDECFEYIADW